MTISRWLWHTKLQWWMERQENDSESRQKLNNRDSSSEIRQRPWTWWGVWKQSPETVFCLEIHFFYFNFAFIWLRVLQSQNPELFLANRRYRLYAPENQYKKTTKPLELHQFHFATPANKQIKPKPIKMFKTVSCAVKNNRLKVKVNKKFLFPL